MDLVKQDGNDSLDMIIRRAVGKEPFLSFPKPENSPVQLFQLLQAFDQPELPGWPLLTPMKIQMQKCEKCSSEFCSPVNYRRHIRMHRRLRRPNKDSGKERNALGAFWDKLPVDEAMEIVSLNGMMLEEIPGSSVEMGLVTLVQKPGFTALPQYYLRAGSDLLDIVQARPHRFPISSQELFSILDDASEKAFLCGTEASMQKYIFDGETGKNVLGAKNVVASASFLLEQRLIKAWLADKDAEALRCHKLLVEEEEAARRRQAELLAKKRRKKLRQREQKVKDQRSEHQEHPKEGESTTTSEEHQDPAESSSQLSIASDSEAQRPDSLPIEDSSSLEELDVLEPNNDANVGPQEMTGQVAYDHEFTNGQKRGGYRQTSSSKWLAPGRSNGFHTNQTTHASKFGNMPKNGTNRDNTRTPAMINPGKVWSRKAENPKTLSSHDAVVTQTKKSEVLIGSISVTIAKDGEHNQTECSEEEAKAIIFQGSLTFDQSTVKIWRPVSRQGSKASDTEVIRNGVIEPNSTDNSHHKSLQQYNSHEAKAFLAQRWKEATTEEHVRLVLSPESDITTSKPKLWTKPDKNTKMKYVPKQRKAA